MNSFQLSSQELSLIALVFNEELKRIENEFPEDLADSESYASQIKLLHRRILSFVP